MAWTSPKTWASEPLTSSDLNTYVRDNQEYLKDLIDSTAKQYIRTSGDYTTSSTSYVDVDATNLALTITTTGGDVLVTFAGYLAHTFMYPTTLAVNVDGVDYLMTQHTRQGSSGTTTDMNMCFSYIFTGLSAGSHTFKLRWKVGHASGVATLYAGTPLFDVRQIGGQIS